MNYMQIANRLNGSLWAIEPSKLETIRHFLNVKLSGGDVPRNEIEAAASQRRKPLRAVKGKVAVLPIFGTLIQHAGGMEQMSGAVDPVQLGRDFDALMADDSIGAIVLQIDSPGGVVFGIQELSDKIHSSRGQGKRIVSVADGYAASAAYFIGSAADEFVASPSSLTGSIGVYQMHIDVSQWEEREGVKTTLISAGKHKVEGNSFEPLGEDARERIQSEVNEFYADFVNTVARNRGATASEVRSGYGEGRVLTAREAVKQGLADRIGTVEEIVNALAGAKKTGRNAATLRRKLAIS